MPSVLNSISFSHRSLACQAGLLPDEHPHSASLYLPLSCTYATKRSLLIIRIKLFFLSMERACATCLEGLVEMLTCQTEEKRLDLLRKNRTEKKEKKYDPARIRTWNPLIRSQMPYPLGHRATHYTPLNK